MKNFRGKRDAASFCIIWKLLHQQFRKILENGQWLKAVTGKKQPLKYYSIRIYIYMVYLINYINETLNYKEFKKLIWMPIPVCFPPGLAGRLGHWFR